MGIKLLTGNSHPGLARNVAQSLGINLTPCTVSKFSDNETSVNIGESVRDHDVFVLQTGFNPSRQPIGPFSIKSDNISRPASPSRGESDVNPALIAHQSAIKGVDPSHDPNDLLMELLIMISACKTASARRITAVIPCFPYSRMDRKDAPRTPITAKMVARMLQIAGCDRVITIDLHANQIQGFFDFPVDNLLLELLIVRWVKENVEKWEDSVIVSPDAGGAKRATFISDRLNVDFALINQTHHGRKRDMVLVGDVKDKTALIIDDMCDTGETMSQAMRVLKEGGAKAIYAIATHGILSGETTLNLLKNDRLAKVVVSDTVCQEEHLKMSKDRLAILPTSNLLAESIRRTHNGESISILFNNYL